MAFVPIGPGIPFIPNNDFIAGSISLLVQDALDLIRDFLSPQWGLYLDGVPVIVAETVLDMSIKTEAVISNYQVEQGGFESYNKVQLPTKVRFRFVSGGGPEIRQALIDSCTAAQQSLDVFDAVMPEKTYTSINVESLDFRRTSSVGLVMIDLHCEEIRVNTSTEFSNVKSPSASDTQNNGNVQAEAPTQSQGQLVETSGFF